MKCAGDWFRRQLKVMFLVWLVLMLTPAGMLMALTPMETASAAKKTNGWASQYMDMFSQNDILYYNPDECVDGENASNQTCVDGNCSAGVLPGNTNEELVWNYFAQANISGVSDNPAVIAGMIGSLRSESGLDPFAVNDGRYGLHAVRATEFVTAVDNAGLGQYWGKDADVPAEAVSQAIEIELDWIVQNDSKWMGGCFEESCWEETWRKDAQEIYDQYAGTGATPSGSNSGFSDMNTLSGTANQKYDAENGDLIKLLKFSIWEADQNGGNYKDVLSSILDDFEKNNSDKKGDVDSLMEYVEDSEKGAKFKYRSDYDTKYNTLSIDREPDSEQEQAARNIVNKGLRTTSAGQSQITNGKESNVNYCKGNSSKKGVGAERIAEVAALMSWPVQSTQTNADDYQSIRVGKCFDGNSWVEYTGTNSACRTVPRDLYKNNLAGYAYTDCGVFVMSVLNYLGLEVFNGQPNAGTFFRTHTDEWQELPETMTEADLKPGDIMWEGNTKSEHGHIYIYLGEKYGGEFGTIAHASVPWDGNPSGRVGEIGPNYSDWPQAWYTFRYIGNKLGGGNCGEYEGGEAIACEAEYLAWSYEDKDKAYAGILTEEYKEAKDRWFGPNDGTATGGNENDVSCARFASLTILESGVDPGFASSSSPSRSNIKWLDGFESGTGMEGYLARSSNWTKVTNGKPERGDIIVDESQPHVWIYLGDGMIAEGAGLSGTNRAGLVMPEFNTAYGSYNIYRARV